MWLCEKDTTTRQVISTVRDQLPSAYYANAEVGG